MKKVQMATLLVLLVSLLTACGEVLNEAKNAVTYTTEAVDFVDDMYKAADTIPVLAKEAGTNETSQQQLIDVILEVKSDMEEFNELTPPAAIQDVHSNIVENNSAILVTIQEYLPIIESGNFTQEEVDMALSMLSEEMQVMQSFVDEIKSFGK